MEECIWVGDIICGAFFPMLSMPPSCFSLEGFGASSHQALIPLRLGQEIGFRWRLLDSGVCPRRALSSECARGLIRLHSNVWHYRMKQSHTPLHSLFNVDHKFCTGLHSTSSTAVKLLTKHCQTLNLCTVLKTPHTVYSLL